MRITVIFGGIERVSLISDPGLHSDEVSHERRNGAFEQRCVASDHVLVVHVALVGLMDH